MKSKWFESKDKAIALRSVGISITVIEKKLGVPRSTLSGWFKNINIEEPYKERLALNTREALSRARLKAVEWHKAQKELRLLRAKQEATYILDQISINKEILDLAFAMLYLGEGSKSSSSIASSDPRILRFVLSVIKHNYSISPLSVRCDLHLRMDQDKEKLKKYWSNELNIPLSNFKYVAYDQRSAGKKTYPRYMGVCVIYFGSIAIQRKLEYLYSLFMERVESINMGV